MITVSLSLSLACSCFSLVVADSPGCHVPPVNTSSLLTGVLDVHNYLENAIFLVQLALTCKSSVSACMDEHNKVVMTAESDLLMVMITKAECSTY